MPRFRILSDTQLVHRLAPRPALRSSRYFFQEHLRHRKNISTPFRSRRTSSRCSPTATLLYSDSCMSNSAPGKPSTCAPPWKKKTACDKARHGGNTIYFRTSGADLECRCRYGAFFLRLCHPASYLGLASSPLYPTVPPIPSTRTRDITTTAPLPQMRCRLIQCQWNGETMSITTPTTSLFPDPVVGTPSLANF